LVVGGGTLREATEAFQRAWLSDVLARHGGRVASAAREAGMDRSNFHRALRKLGLLQADDHEAPG
uniref:helix-turn-helix domain-containing protein n=1 Tax=Variovorax sp. YR752 TaxID=1884383 RepID=UPI0031381554